MGAVSIITMRGEGKEKEGQRRMGGWAAVPGYLKGIPNVTACGGDGRGNKKRAASSAHLAYATQ